MTARYSAKKLHMLYLLFSDLHFSFKINFILTFCCCVVNKKTFSFLLLKNAKFEEHENLLLKFVQLLVVKNYIICLHTNKPYNATSKAKIEKIEVRRDCNFYYCLLQIKRSTNEVASHWKEQLTKKLYKKVNLIGVRAGLNIRKS